MQVHAKVLARRGDHEAALGVAEQANDLADSIQAPVLQGDAALDLAEVLQLAGSRARAEVESDRAIQLYEQEGATACVARAEASRRFGLSPTRRHDAS